MNVNLSFRISLKYDKLSECWIAHNKKYTFTGYGYTKRDAIAMFKECIYNTLLFKNQNLI